ncbi:MAG: DUF2235 domain-containing protein [Motiliproteus sp.]|nr:DUF2235 domain-containing protein [Motiliproteus sp.]
MDGKVSTTAGTSKNLVVFSDGTGNSGGVTNDTNVWRLYQMVASCKDNQLTFYDDGVGTSNVGLIKAISGALGIGIGHNIRQIYEFLVKNYNEGDKIYLFGFSRGAYTVRCLLGFLTARGLVNRYQPASSGCKNLKDESDLRKEIRENFDLYKSIYPELQKKGIDKNNTTVRAEFIGVWDTVDAVGMPIDELKALDFLAWYFFKKQRAYTFNDRTLRGVNHARQALAIDDERRTFHPNYWLGCGDGVDMKQVWFTGMHSNVGGSYPKDGLAYISLEWMIDEIRALNLDLKFPNSCLREVRYRTNAHDKMYDSRAGLGVFYRYSPRNLMRIRRGNNSFWFRQFSKIDWFKKFGVIQQVDHEGPKLCIHQSVWQRIVQGNADYAPLFIHDEQPIDLVYTQDPDSAYSEQAFNRQFPHIDQFPSHDAGVIEKLDAFSARKQKSYLGFVVAALLGLVYFATANQGAPEATGTLATLVKQLTPDLMAEFIDRMFASGLMAILWIIALLVLYIYNLKLEKNIRSFARKAWTGHFKPLCTDHPDNAPTVDQNQQLEESETKSPPTERN